MDIDFQDGFELDEDDLDSVFFYATRDGAPIQIRVDAGALGIVAPGNIREDASDQFLDSRASFEALAAKLIQQGRAQDGYLEITATAVAEAKRGN